MFYKMLYFQLLDKYHKNVPLCHFIWYYTTDVAVKFYIFILDFNFYNKNMLYTYNINITINLEPCTALDKFALKNLFIFSVFRTEPSKRRELRIAKV